MKKISLTILLFITLLLSELLIFQTSSAYAASCSDADSWDISGYSKEYCNDHSGYKRVGVLYIPASSVSAYSKYYGIEDVPQNVTVRRRVFEASGETWKGKCDAVHVHFTDSLVSGITDSSISVNCAGGDTWSGESSDYINLPLNIWRLAQLTSSSSTSCAGTAGLFCVDTPYTRCMWTSGSKPAVGSSACGESHVRIAFYKISDITHDAPYVEVNGTKYTTDGETIKVTSETATVKFYHNLNRNDGWSGNYNVKKLYGLNSSVNSGVSGMGSSYSITDDKGSVAATYEGNKVCSEVNHYTTVGLADYDYGTGSGQSKMCVTIMDDRTYLDANSKSSVSNSIDTGGTEDGGTKTVESWGGSRNDAGKDTKTYPYYFVHQLKVKGDSNRSVTLTYDIERSTNGGASWTTVVSGGSRTVNGNNSWVEVRGYSNSLDNFVLKQGESSSTVCERITFKSKQTEFRGDSTTGTANGVSGTSTVCTKINRRNPKSVSLSATSDMWVDGVKNPEGVQYSLSGSRGFQYKFEITNSENSNRALNTTYTIERLIYRATDSKDWSKATIAQGPTTVTTPKTGTGSITNNFTITIPEGESRVVCERIKLDPYQYLIHVNGAGNEEGSPEAITGNAYFAERCATVTRPEPVEFRDPDIFVHGRSKGELANPSQAAWSESYAAWLLKTEYADITYSHQLYRDDVRHTDSNSTATDNVVVNYVFNTPNITIPASTLDTTYINPQATVANNSETAWFLSNTTDPLKNVNTRTTSIKVTSEPVEICQSVHYLSSLYESYGTYWAVDGVRLSSLTTNFNDELLGSRVKRTDNVGISPKGCVKIIRPYNFRISRINNVVGETASKPPSVGTIITNTYEFVVEKNDSDYLITDIPSAKIRVISFVVDGKPDNVVGGTIDSGSSPCDFWRSKINIISECNDNLHEETQNIHPTNSTNSGNNYYTNIDHYTYRFTNKTELPNLPVTSKYCVAIAVAPSDSGDNGYGFPGTFNDDWTISNASCTNIGKNPNAQIWGGSVFVNGGIKTSFTNTFTDNTSSAKATFGSWADFMIIANKNISKMASGASLISGLPVGQDLSLATTRLDISNTNKEQPGNADIINASALIEKIHDRYLVSPTTYYKTSTISTETLQEETVRKMSPVVFYNTGDIFITDNITFSRRVFSDTAVPQVIIYSEGNIYIDDDVIKVDAWLLAPNGRINTCANSSGVSLRISATTCQLLLTVRGPMYAQSVIFDRTAGADANQNTAPEPAEIVDYSPAVILFGANEMAQNAQPITTYIHRLPPRY